jgi:NADH-quinone oxidoreductase subunit N
MGLEINAAAFAPALVLLIVACATLLWALFEADSRLIAGVTLLGIAFSAAITIHLFGQETTTGVAFRSFGLQYNADAFSTGFTLVILLGATFAILMSYHYLKRTGLEYPEYYPLITLSSMGAIVMASAGDLIILVLGLEIMSLAVYVLSAWRQDARESEEAGMKYFLLGAFASAFLIYGIALMYGATGNFTYDAIATALQGEGFASNFYAALGAVMILAGLGFKVAFAPFHQWAPDVYTGAPTPVTAFMSVAVKAAAFAALLRFTSLLLPALPGLVTTLLAVMVALTLIIGNLGALLQTGLKRMLAYSAVAHAGYLGLAVLAVSATGARAAIWYLTAYALMNAGAFAVLTLLTDKNDKGDALERLAGLGYTRPGLAAALSIFLLSLAGIPLFAGFVGKILVFQAAIAAGYIALAVLGILTSVVAVVYYIRPIAYMYFRESEYEPLQVESATTRWAIGAAAALTVLLGIFPGWWYGILALGRSVVGGY